MNVLTLLVSVSVHSGLFDGASGSVAVKCTPSDQTLRCTLSWLTLEVLPPTGFTVSPPQEATALDALCATALGTKVSESTPSPALVDLCKKPSAARIEWLRQQPRACMVSTWDTAIDLVKTGERDGVQSYSSKNALTTKFFVGIKTLPQVQVVDFAVERTGEQKETFRRASTQLRKFDQACSSLVLFNKDH